MASGTIKSPVIAPVSLSGDYSNIDMATSLSYTGVSITIPAHCAYSISVKASYDASQPQYVTLNTSSTNNSAQVAGGALVSLICQYSYNSVNTGNSFTLYVWARYGAAGKNSITVRGFYIPI